MHEDRDHGETGIDEEEEDGDSEEEDDDDGEPDAKKQRTS